MTLLNVLRQEQPTPRARVQRRPYFSIGIDDATLRYEGITRVLVLRVGRFCYTRYRPVMAWRRYGAHA